jgi:hypothetical protein
MKHIKVYLNKVESILKNRSTKETKPTKKAEGFLQPMNKQEDTSPKKKDDLEIIADFVQGIRDSKKEVLNGKK